MLNRIKHTHTQRLSRAANSKSRTTYDNGQAASLGPVAVMYPPLQAEVYQPLQAEVMCSADSTMPEANKLVGKACSTRS